MPTLDELLDRAMEILESEWGSLRDHRESVRTVLSHGVPLSDVSYIAHQTRRPEYPGAYFWQAARERKAQRTGIDPSFALVPTTVPPAFTERLRDAFPDVPDHDVSAATAAAVGRARAEGWKDEEHYVRRCLQETFDRCGG